MAEDRRKLPARRHEGVQRLPHRIARMDDVHRNGDSKILGYRLGTIQQSGRPLQIPARPARLRPHGRLHLRKRAAADSRGAHPDDKDSRRMRLAHLQPALPPASRTRHARCLPGLRVSPPPDVSHGHVDGAETPRLPHDEAQLTSPLIFPLNQVTQAA